MRCLEFNLLLRKTPQKSLNDTWHEFSYDLSFITAIENQPIVQFRVDDLNYNDQRQGPATTLYAWLPDHAVDKGAMPRDVLTDRYPSQNFISALNNNIAESQKVDNRGNYGIYEKNSEKISECD